VGPARRSRRASDRGGDDEVGAAAEGTKIALDDRGEICGAVSGGCVEGAVIEVAEGVLAGAEPRLLIVGEVDFAAQLLAVAALAEWRAFVVDPRTRFATPDRFRAAERVIVALRHGRPGGRLIAAPGRIHHAVAA
jgi:xanthine dehydrogenase accessory factor